MPFDISGVTLQSVINIIILIFGVFYSIILHEIGHGITAFWFGDPTAKAQDRLSLNPVPHIDIIGTVILPLSCLLLGLPLFGWAKPVPINPLNFSKLRLGMIVVSLAGVTVNFILTACMFFIFSLTHMTVFLQIASVNIMLMAFNLIPLPPLDGYNFLITALPQKISRIIRQQQTTLMIILLVLLVTPLSRFVLTPIYNTFAGFFFALFNVRS